MERNHKECRYNDILLLPCDKLLVEAHYWAVDNKIMGSSIENYIKTKKLKKCPFCNREFKC